MVCAACDGAAAAEKEARGHGGGDVDEIEVRACAGAAEHGQTRHADDKGRAGVAAEGQQAAALGGETSPCRTRAATVDAPTG